MYILVVRELYNWQEYKERFESPFNSMFCDSFLTMQFVIVTEMITDFNLYKKN